MAERANQDILQGARTILVATGPPGCFWSYAAPYYCLMESLTYSPDGVRLYDRWAGEEFGGKIIPFGAAVEYVPPSTRPEEQPGKGRGTSMIRSFSG